MYAYTHIKSFLIIQQPFIVITITFILPMRKRRLNDSWFHSYMFLTDFFLYESMRLNLKETKIRKIQGVIYVLLRRIKSGEREVLGKKIII